jgi:hypothetical protein
MKKIAAIFLVFLYLIPSVGFSMNLHFCGGNVTGVSIQKTIDKDCVCGKKASSKCCKEVHVEVKLDDSQKAASSLIVSKQVNEIKLFRNAFPNTESINFSSANHTVYYYPSRFQVSLNKPVYIMNSALLL